VAEIPSEWNVSIPMHFKVVERKELPQWEYKYVPLPSTETLNALGIKGWQCVMYVPANNSFLMIREILPEVDDSVVAGSDFVDPDEHDVIMTSYKRPQEAERPVYSTQDPANEQPEEQDDE
jgi:hypothetical protein